MVDLSTTTIKKIFEQQLRELTKRTVLPMEESFNYQFSGGWIQ
ncbi:MAG TPA: hypothetical protein VJC39_04225 [Candidatus Nanoarchaeia archaeon]|nr:hypothetical protein [Candidatus Nanoarchaeia archaeon]